MDETLLGELTAWLTAAGLAGAQALFMIDSGLRLASTVDNGRLRKYVSCGRSVDAPIVATPLRGAWSPSDRAHGECLASAFVPLLSARGALGGARYDRRLEPSARTA